MGVEQEGELVGVAVASHPLARMLDRDRFLLEITRTCTTGAKNANSMLYGAVARAAKALGYRRLITYTLAEESGASLRAAGWTLESVRAPTRSWTSSPAGVGQGKRLTLFGEPKHPVGEKIRWIKELGAA